MSLLTYKAEENVFCFLTFRETWRAYSLNESTATVYKMKNESDVSSSPKVLDIDVDESDVGLTPKVLDIRVEPVLNGSSINMITLTLSGQSLLSESDNATIYVGFLPLPLETDFGIDISESCDSRPGACDLLEINCTIETRIAKCLYWDEDNQQWSHTGCQVIHQVYFRNRNINTHYDEIL